MKTLVFITSHFPFGTGESFIRSELPLLSQYFGKIILISQDTTRELTQSTPDNVTVYRYSTSTSFSGFFYLPLLALNNYASIKSLIKEEIDFRKNIGDNLSLRKRVHLFKKIIKALQLRDFIKGLLNTEEIESGIIFYSYWFKTGAHAIAMLKYSKSIKIARAHGSDIYEEKMSTSYLPLMKYTAQNLDAIFFISNHGKEYLSEKVKISTPGFIMSPLGVEKPEPENRTIVRSDKFVIVSCSNMVPLKRIDMIISSLELVKSDKEIQWVHFGDGILRSELEALAAKRLGPLHKTTYSFMGHYPNNELIKYYNLNNADLFLNTSLTEGVPVSIMEAQSFGIPAIATDVGGVKEVVSEGTGRLIPVGFKPEDLAMLIEFFVRLPEDEINLFRMKAFSNWQQNFNATVNYRDFITKVNSILASVKE